MQIQADCVVAISFVMRNDQGQVLDSTQGRLPLLYLHGHGHILPGLENALEGRSVGDVVDVLLPPAQAYGERDSELVQCLPRAVLESETTISVGMYFEAQTEEGPLPVRVMAVTEDTLTVDGNHEWAGETLHFSVQVRHVRKASPQELAEGEADPDAPEPLAPAHRA